MSALPEFGSAVDSLMGLLEMLAVLVTSDSCEGPDEVQRLLASIDQQPGMDLMGNEHLFRLATMSGTAGGDVLDHLDVLKAALPEALWLQVYQVAHALCTADGAPDPGEESLLKTIQERLGLSATQF